MRLVFHKYEGTGNDFVVLDERARFEPALSVSARVALCDRHTGVGADGVLTILAPRVRGSAARMHITNADGSEPEMCGNGLRCVSLFLLHERAVARGEEHFVDTDAGQRKSTVLDGDADAARVRVDMGAARFDVPAQIPAWLRAPLVVDGVEVVASTASMGNPHVALELPSSSSPALLLELALRLGPRLERDARFPQRTNVEVVALRPDGGVDVVVWERGVGITQACGTGACAVAAVLARAGAVPHDADVTVRLPGGALIVRAPADGGTVWMTGPARRVFAGETETARA